MSRVVIVAVGSRGDVAPLTGVGVALQHAGHTVSIVAYTPFAEMITKCGLGFRELPANLEPAADGAEVQPIKGLAAFASPTGMRALGHNILAAVENEPADIALLSPFAEMVDHAYARVVADFRRELGLTRTPSCALRKQRTEADWPILHGYSTLVVPRPLDWRPGLEVTGYWWPACRGDWTPPADLTRFLSDGPAPVFVGFGSLMVNPARAEQLSDLIGQAAAQAGVRVLVQAGWADLHVADGTVMTIGDTPHDWLFPNVAAVAHHCGAGTTAAGLRAGVPTIALPAYGDGPFWAARLTALGVAAATINQRRLTVDRLATAMRTAVTDPQLRDNALRLSAAIAAEDGAAQAVNAVESRIQLAWS